MKRREYRVDTADGVVYVPMSEVGTHADVEYIDHPVLAPDVFVPHLPSPYIWSIRLVVRYYPDN